MSAGKMKISKVNEGAFVEDEKKPAKLIVEVKKTETPQLYQIQIIHPNRRADFTREVLYTENHKAKDMLEAMAIGNKIKESQFFDVHTVYEDIKFIPNYKKGKMKLNTKEDADAKIAENNKIIPLVVDKAPKKNKKIENKKVPAKKAKKHS